MSRRRARRASRPPSSCSTSGCAVNGVPRSAAVPGPPAAVRLPAPRPGLTGTHVGCEHGVCGACTVLVDGQPMRSCLMFAVTAQDHEITTVEGLGNDPDGR